MKTNCCLILLVLFFSFQPSIALTQVLKRVAVTDYNIDNGLLQNTVSNMVVDRFGVVWFSTSSGVQRFNGSYFETINFNDDSSAFQSALLTLVGNEEIWVSHSKGITAFNPETNRRRTITSQQQPMHNYLYRFLAEDSTTAWYISYPNAFLQFEKKSGRLITTLPMSKLPDALNIGLYCKQINNEKAVLRIGKTIALFNLKEKRTKILHASKEWITGIVPLNDRTILFAKEGCYYSLDIQSGKETLIRRVNDVKPNTSFHFFLNDQGNLISGYGKNIYELDTASLAIKTKWVAYNQDNLINSGGVTGLYADRFGRFWILTNSDGVKKLNIKEQRFRYYGTSNKETNFIRSIHVNKKRGIVLAGTFGNGLLLFDTSGYLLQQIAVNDTNSTISDIIELPDDKYLLAVMGYHPFYILDLKSRKAVPAYSDAQKRLLPHCSYYGNLEQLNDGSFIFSDNVLYRFRLKNDRVTDTTTLRNGVSWVYSFCKLKNGGYCIASEQGIELTDAVFQQKSFLHFQQPVAVRCIKEDNKGMIWIGSERGLYKISAGNQLVKKYVRTDGLADEVIYSIEPADNGIYFSHNKGLSFMSDEGKLVHYNRYSGLQENEFNSNSSFKHHDGEIYFGGVNGISSFFPKTLSLPEKSPFVYITTLHVMDKPWKDTAVWNIKALNLEYDANRIALRIGVPASADNQYVYEYKMQGLEPDWITTSGTDFIRYVLPPGSYTFKVRTSNGKEGSISETSLQIHVQAPFWQTTWFKMLVALLILSVIVLFILRYVRGKYLKKIRQLEIEHKLQLERERISRDLHDNLGAYASAIADNVDKVAKNPADIGRLKNLKASAAEIMNNLRDTIWALNKTEISVLTLSDRIKAFLQKMREAFPAVKITLEEKITVNTSLSPEFALNILRIVQEALHNAIKHSGANEIVLVVHIQSQLYISVKDNGVGIADENNSRGNGMQNMKMRAKENDLRIRITSLQKKGTSVELFS